MTNQDDDQETREVIFNPLSFSQVVANQGAFQTIPCLTIIYHDNLDRVGDRLIMEQLLRGESVHVSRTSPRFVSEKFGLLGKSLKDSFVSRGAFVLSMTQDGLRFERAECRSKIEVDGEPLDQYIDLSIDALKEGVVILLARRVVLLLHLYESLSQNLSTLLDESDFGIIGFNPEIKKLRQDLRNVAKYDVPVLLRGESGTGKELAAAAIHKFSPRKDRTFVSVNMGALPPTLAATELFGAHRGAYTGATQAQEGYFRKANQGTLFLDEVGDTPPEIQVALLRVLETKEVIALGAQKPYRVDTRIVAATDADLDAQMASGAFREQLMHRLAGYEIWLPPLRRRRDDLGHLLIYFLRQELEQMGEEHRLEANVQDWLPPKVVATMATYHWPGNVRELRNVVKQLLIHNSQSTTIKLPKSLLNRFRKNRSSEELPSLYRLLADRADTPLAGRVDSDIEHSELEEEPAYDKPDAAVEAMVVPDKSEKASEEKIARRRPKDVSEEELSETYHACRYELAATAKALRLSRGSLYNRIQASPNLRLPSELTSDELRDAHAKCGGDLDEMVDRLEVSKTALRRRLIQLKLPVRSD